MAEHAEAFEILFHDVDEVERVIAASLTQFEGPYVFLLGAHFLHHLVFDRETVAVPTRVEGDVESGHRTRADRDVF